MTNTADQPSHFTDSKFVKTVEELNLNLVRKKVRYPLITETATEGCFFFLVFYQTSLKLNVILQGTKRTWIEFLKKMSLSSS